MLFSPCSLNFSVVKYSDPDVSCSIRYDAIIHLPSGETCARLDDGLCDTKFAIYPELVAPEKCSSHFYRRTNTSLTVSLFECEHSWSKEIAENLDPSLSIAKESFSSSTILPHSFLFFVSQLSSAFAIVFGICCFTNRSHQKTTRISDRYLSYILEYHKFIGSQTSHHRQRVVAIVKKKSLL